jgi:hypothetical protein
MTDPTLRFNAGGPPKRTRRYTPIDEKLADMNGAAVVLGVCRRTLERLLQDPNWRGPRPFRHRPRSKPLFRRSDLEAYRDAAALLGRSAPGSQP